MSSADRYATLSEIWGADSWEVPEKGQRPVTKSAYDTTSPTCNPGGGGGGGAAQQPWCDLYNNGYNREVDSIMDMYTPGDSIPAEVRYDHKKNKNAGSSSGPGLSGPLCFSDGDKETILPFEMSMYSAGLSYAPFEVRSSSKKNRASSSNNTSKGRRGEDNEDADDVTTERDDEYNDDYQYQKSSKEHRSSRRNEMLEDDFDLDFDQLNQYATYQAGPKRCAPRKERPVTNPNTPVPPTTTTTTTTTNTTTNTPTTPSPSKTTTSTPNKTSTAPPPQTEGFYNDAASDDDEEIVEIRTRTRTSSTSRQDSGQPTCYLDIALYFLSGVILIFVLEQFVQLGLHMR